MSTIDSQTIKDYIQRRKNELFQHVMGLSTEEATTQHIRGRHAELRKLEQQIELNFAHPEGRNESS